MLCCGGGCFSSNQRRGGGGGELARHRWVGDAGWGRVGCCFVTGELVNWWNVDLTAGVSRAVGISCVICMVFWYKTQKEK
jgi:hypothetical protein